MRYPSASVKAERVPPVEQAAIAFEEPRGRRILPVALPATACGLLAFLVIQTLLTVYTVDVIRDATARGLVDGYSLSLWDRLLPALVGGSIGYVVLALAGVAISSRGHRLLFTIPAAAYVLTTFLLDPIHQPEPIGRAWSLQCFALNDICSGPWFGHPWIGGLADLGLVFLPGFVVALRVEGRRWRGAADAPAIAAVLAVVASVLAAGWAIAVIEGYVHVQELAAVGAAGLLIGTARRWWPWIPVLLAAFVTGAIEWLWYPILFPDPNFPFSQAWPYVLERTWPMVAVGLVASGWEPLAWLLRRAEERPLRLVIAVNILNLADAVLTAVAVESGGALEANPVVRLAGLPAKIVLVGLLTWLLYRRRPSALVWPVAALAAVTCYHVSGILVNGWR